MNSLLIYTLSIVAKQKVLLFTVNCMLLYDVALSETQEVIHVESSIAAYWQLQPDCTQAYCLLPQAASQSQSQSHFTTDSQSASPAWCQAPIWDQQPIFISP
jgi:hypothetical protein